MNDDVRITITVSADTYKRLSKFLAAYGVVRNRFMVDAIEDRLQTLCPRYARSVLEVHGGHERG